MVVRTNPGVVLPPGSVWSLTVGQADDPPLQVGVLTGYEESSWSAPVARVLYLVVDRAAASLEDAVIEALGSASGLTTIMAFIGNRYVESPELHVAYDTTGDRAEHEFVRTYRPEYGYLPEPAAVLDVESFQPVHDCLLRSDLGARSGMTLVHYNEALRSLRPAGDVLAAEHQFAAVEALAGIVRKREMQARGYTDELELAKCFGIDTTEPWKARNELTGYLRRTMIFSGDDVTHQALKKASDGFEHGYLPIVDVRKHAESGILPAAFDHVRNAILDLLDLPEDLRGYLAATKPTYNDRIHANIRGVIDGGTSHPEDPTSFRELDFTVSLADVVPADGGLRLRLEPHVDPTFADGASLKDYSFLFYRERLGQSDDDQDTTDE